MNSKRFTVFCDMDGVIANCLDYWLEKYNKDYDDDLKPEDIVSYNTHKYVKPECGLKIYDYILEEGFFLNATCLQEDIDELRRLHDSDIDVHFATKAPFNSKYVMREKCQWVDKHFPFIGSNKIIFLQNKSLLRGDFLIEDCPDNLVDFKGIKILYTRPWNQYVDDYHGVRCYSMNDVVTTILICANKDHFTNQLK